MCNNKKYIGSNPYTPVFQVIGTLSGVFSFFYFVIWFVPTVSPRVAILSGMALLVIFFFSCFVVLIIYMIRAVLVKDDDDDDDDSAYRLAKLVAQRRKGTVYGEFR